MTVLFIIGVVLILVGFGFYLSDHEGTACFLLLFGGYIVSVPIWEYGDRDKPQAIDVYRGRTTLEITYRDSIPVDTIVVFNGR